MYDETMAILPARALSGFGLEALPKCLSVIVVKLKTPRQPLLHSAISSHCPYLPWSLRVAAVSKEK